MNKTPASKESMCWTGERQKMQLCSKGAVLISTCCMLSLSLPSYTHKDINTQSEESWCQIGGLRAAEPAL